jgi:hypothetical protein
MQDQKKTILANKMQKNILQIILQRYLGFLSDDN